jgi:hypothetical protein
MWPKETVQYNRTHDMEKPKMIKPSTTSPLEIAKASMPFFGGAETVATPDDETPAAATDSTATGGDKVEAPAVDPVAQLQADPNALAQLLQQVTAKDQELNATKTKLQQYETEKQAADRAKLSEVEQLKTDLAQREQVIEGMDRVIRHNAVTTALLQVPNTEWHSVKQVMAELDESAYDVQVDLENGQAVVTGIEQEAKRIASNYPWLVKSNGANDATRTRAPRSSGAPPTGPSDAGAKQARRTELMKKFPVIAGSRPIA